MRQMLGIPADPSGQRPVLVVLVHGGEISPSGISAHDFRDAGFEVNAEPLPSQQKKAGARGGMVAAKPGPKTRWREEKRDEPGFEQHAVRLILGKILCDRDKRNKTDEANEKRDARPNI